MIPMYKPFLPKSSLKYVHDVLDRGYVSSGSGQYKKLIEEKLKELVGCKYVFLMSNGTCAMHLVYKCMQNFYKAERVFVPNNVYVGAINPLFYDGNKINVSVLNTNQNTWNAEYENLNIGLGSGYILLVVHNVGNIVNVLKLKEKYPHALVIEDNCEGFLGKYGGKPTGSESVCSAISFYSNKQITSGEGGAFCTNDKELYNYAVKAGGQGMSKKWWVFDVLGYNYRITNIQAALLYGQFDVLSEIRERKRVVFESYRNLLKHERIMFQSPEVDTEPTNWMVGIRILGNTSYARIERFLKDKDIETRPFFYPLSYHTHLKNLLGRHPQSAAERLSRECVLLPSYPELSEKQIKYICDSILEYVERKDSS